MQPEGISGLHRLPPKLLFFFSPLSSSFSYFLALPFFLFLLSRLFSVGPVSTLRGLFRATGNPSENKIKEETATYLQ